MELMQGLLKRRSRWAFREVPIGLTLIELLVTLLLTAVLSVMGFRVLERFVISQEGLVQQAAFQRSLALTWAQLEADLRSLAALSPKQRVDMLRVEEGGFFIGDSRWQVQKDGVFSRQTLGQTDSMSFMSRVDDVRLALWVGGEERELTTAPNLDLERFARQELGLVVEMRLAGYPHSLRKVFLVPASPGL